MEENNGILTENLETNTEIDALLDKLFDTGIAYGKWCGYESLHDVIAVLERDRESLKAECLKYESKLASKEAELKNARDDNAALGKENEHLYKTNKAIGAELDSARQQMKELKASRFVISGQGSGSGTIDDVRIVSEVIGFLYAENHTEHNLDELAGMYADDLRGMIKRWCENG